MTKQDAKTKLIRAQELIFEVEKEFIEGEFPRLHGYRARIALATFQDNIGFTYRTKDENLITPKNPISSSLICPACKSNDTVGTGAGDNYRAENMECYTCGHEWEMKKT